MAIEKLYTDNGVDITISDTHINFYELDIDSPVASQLISIPISDWEQVVNFVTRKLNKDAK